jgi:hypothetical protein
MRWILICIGLMIGGGVMMYDKSQKLATMKKLAAEGVPTKGYPTETYEKRGKRSGTSYYVKFEYETKGGMRKGDLEVEHPYYSQINERTIMNLRYLPSDPAQVMIEGQPLATEGGFYGGVIMLVIGVVGTGIFTVVYLRDRNSSATV